MSAKKYASTYISILLEKLERKEGKDKLVVMTYSDFKRIALALKEMNREILKMKQVLKITNLNTMQYRHLIKQLKKIRRGKYEKN